MDIKKQEPKKEEIEETGWHVFGQFSLLVFIVFGVFKLVQWLCPPLKDEPTYYPLLNYTYTPPAKEETIIIQNTTSTPCFSFLGGSSGEGIISANETNCNSLTTTMTVREFVQKLAEQYKFQPMIISSSPSKLIKQ